MSGENRFKAFKKSMEKIYIALDDYNSQYEFPIIEPKSDDYKILCSKTSLENKSLPYPQNIKNEMRETTKKFQKTVNEKENAGFILHAFYNVIKFYEQINESNILYHPYPNTIEFIKKTFNSFFMIIKPKDASYCKINQSKLITEELSHKANISEAKNRMESDEDRINSTLLPEYQKELDEMSGLLYNIHTHKDEVKAEAKLLRTVTDLTYVIDQINHRDFWQKFEFNDDDNSEYDED